MSKTAEQLKEQRKEWRNNPVYLPGQIIRNCRAADASKGLINDLDEQFVKEMIAPGCIYCGDETPSRMTLDRIDNDKGHTKDNVLPACVRCNTIRRDMPFAAWTALMPYIEDIRKQGLFGDWSGHPKHKFSVEDVDVDEDG